MRMYATPAELAAYPGGDAVPTEDADAFLRTASRVVDRLLIGRVYDVDTDSLPTDPDVIQALSDAACAIALEDHSTGASAAGSTTAWESVGIGSVNLSGGKAADGTLRVDGIPVPASALLALATVGRLVIRS